MEVHVSTRNILKKGVAGFHWGGAFHPPSHNLNPLGSVVNIYTCTKGVNYVGPPPPPQISDFQLFPPCARFLNEGLCRSIKTLPNLFQHLISHGVVGAIVPVLHVLFGERVGWICGHLVPGHTHVCRGGAETTHLHAHV